jgi:hypothetical protein
MVGLDLLIQVVLEVLEVEQEVLVLQVIQVQQVVELGWHQILLELHYFIQVAVVVEQTLLQVLLLEEQGVVE